MWKAEQVMDWLAARGYEQVIDGTWRNLDGGELATDELAADVAEQALEAPELSLHERLELALGLLDLFDTYGVAMYLRFELLDGGSLSEFEPEVWDYFREALGRDVEPVGITYSLWVDWFEDRNTAALWFSEMVRGYEDALSNHASIALTNRLRYIFKNSGPVPWAAKSAILFELSSVSDFQPAIFEALLHGYHDIYGDLDREEALELLARLESQRSNPYFNALRSALDAGVTNHYANPDQRPRGL